WLTHSMCLRLTTHIAKLGRYLTPCWSWRNGCIKDCCPENVSTRCVSIKII
ncbi:HD domain protein, partial [Vibrio parahaemolyticus V-223/04]